MTPAARGLVRTVAAVAAVAGAGLAVAAGARRLEVFRLRRVEVTGLRYLEADAVVRAAAIPPRASVFDGTAAVAERVAAVAGVVHVEVGRRLPATLVLRVVEREPVALAPAGGRLVPIDGEGRALPFDPTRAPTDLPIAARPDTATAALLARLRLEAPALYGTTERARREGGAVVLEGAGRRWRVEPDADRRVFRALELVAQDLDRRGRPWRELDGRFGGQVVVRGGGA